MPLPEEGPCEPWCAWADVLRCVRASDRAALEGVNEDVQGDIILQVSEILYLLDKRRLPGVCEATRSVCTACSCRRWPCCCSHRDRINLGGRWPVQSVSRVVVAGVELTAGVDYHVSDWRWLVRDDGESWPRCADIEDDPENFSVTWTYGRAITEGARRAAAYLAAEIARPCAGLACEQLPQHVSSIQREGITYTILDSFRMLDEGRTGIFLTDLWLAARERGEHVPAGGFDPSRPCTDLRAMDTGTDVS